MASCKTSLTPQAGRTLRLNWATDPSTLTKYCTLTTKCWRQNAKWCIQSTHYRQEDHSALLVDSTTSRGKTGFSMSLTTLVMIFLKISSQIC